jgi:hypothetical protein
MFISRVAYMKEVYGKGVFGELLPRLLALGVLKKTTSIVVPNPKGWEDLPSLLKKYNFEYGLTCFVCLDWLGVLKSLL